jgi:Protein of unknown function (DUF1272)
MARFVRFIVKLTLVKQFGKYLECTFCQACAETILQGQSPNCGLDLDRRNNDRAASSSPHLLATLNYLNVTFETRILIVPNLPGNQ